MIIVYRNIPLLLKLIAKSRISSRGCILEFCEDNMRFIIRFKLYKMLCGPFLELPGLLSQCFFPVKVPVKSEGSRRWSLNLLTRSIKKPVFNLSTIVKRWKENISFKAMKQTLKGSSDSQELPLKFKSFLLPQPCPITWTNGLCDSHGKNTAIEKMFST